MPLFFRIPLALGLGFFASALVAGAMEAVLGEAAFGSARMVALWVATSGLLWLLLPRTKPPTVSPEPQDLPATSLPPSPIEQVHASGKPPHPRTLREMQRQYQRLYEQERQRQHRRP